MSPWEDIEADPEFTTLAPQDKAKLFDDWHSSTVEGFHKELDPEQIDSAGMRGFLASGQAKRRELLGETVTPEQAVKEFDQGLQARSKAQQQTLNDYDELEKAEYKLKDSSFTQHLMSGFGESEAGSATEEDVENKQKALEAARSRFAPGVEQQAKEARQAIRGERHVAVLDGDIYTDPALTLDKEKYREAVQSTNASAEAKLLALADFNNKRDKFAKKALETFNIGGDAPKPYLLGAEAALPDMMSFPKWESEQPAEVRAKKPEAKVLDYLRSMEGRSDFRKIVGSLGTGSIQGGADVANQGIGLAAMASGSDALAKKAGEVEKGSQVLSDVQALEGDTKGTDIFNAGGVKINAATTAGGIARLGVGMTPAIGAGVVSGGSLTAAALAAGAQTAGAQFPTTYNAMIEQGKAPEEALSAARGAALLSGGITTALTAMGGYNGVEALIRRGGMEAARSKLKAVLLTGPLKEIIEELPDEQASQIIESSLTNPDKPISQVVDEFMAKAPDLALQVGILGGGGELLSKQGAPATPATPAEQQRTPVNSAGLGRTVAEVVAESDALAAKAHAQAVESGSPLMAEAIAKNAAAPTPVAQAEETGTAVPGLNQEPEAAAEVATETLPEQEVKAAEPDNIGLISNLLGLPVKASKSEADQAAKDMAKLTSSDPADLKLVRSGNSKVFFNKKTGEYLKMAPFASPEKMADLQQQIDFLAANGADRFAILPKMKILHDSGIAVLSQPPAGVEGLSVMKQAGKDFTQSDQELFKELQEQNPLSSNTNPNPLLRVETDSALKNMGLILGRDGRVRTAAFDFDGFSNEDQQAHGTAAANILNSHPDMEGVPLTAFSPKVQELIRQQFPPTVTTEAAPPLEQGGSNQHAGESRTPAEGSISDVTTGKVADNKSLSTINPEVQGVVTLQPEQLSALTPNPAEIEQAITDNQTPAREAMDLTTADPIMVIRQKDGTLKVAQGHHRLARALRDKVPLQVDIQNEVSTVPIKSIPDRINESSLSPRTTFPTLVQDIKALTGNTANKLQEVADALLPEPMTRPTAEKIARRLMEDNAVQREASAVRERTLEREMLGEEKAQRGDERPVSDEKAPVTQGEFVTWQDENGAMQEGVLTKVNAGRGSLGEPVSEVTLEDSQIVTVPRRELQPLMASNRGNPVQAARAEAIESLRGHLGKEVSVGVSAVDAINGAAELQGDVPGVQKAWVGTRAEFLADEGLRKAFPQVTQALLSKQSDRFEGLFSGGRAFVFTDQVGIYEADIESAAEQEDVSPGQAAVQRVIRHEALVHRGFYALDKPTRRALFQWGAQNIYEGEMDAKAEEYGAGDNWRTDEGSREFLMEEIMAKMIERLKAPPKSGPMKQLWDILAAIWRKLTGRSREVTLKDIHDVAKLLRTALELSENNVQTRDGMPIRVQVPRASMAGGRGAQDAEYMAAVESGDVAKQQAMVDAAAKAAGYDRKLFHGTNSTETVEGESTSGSAEATESLKALAKRVGLSNWSGVTSVYQRLADNGQMGVTQADAANAKRWQKEASGTYEPSREKLSFDVFSPPAGELELGVHLGNESAASMFGEVFPFFTKLGKPFRLPDLGTWNYQSVIRELRKRGVKISEGEYDEVFNARDNNAALRELLKSKGIPSVVYRNEAEGEGDSFIAFDPNQIKSADPITRDAEGNVIPLSQRFNDQSNDIRFSVRPQFTNPLDQTLSNTAKALRLMRDGPPAQPVNLQEVYRKAQVGKSSAMVSLDDMFAEARKVQPDLTEAEFGQQVQALYDDNGAYIEPAESPTVMKASGEKYNVRMQGVPASYVMVLDEVPVRASLRPQQDAEYMAAVESGDVAKQQAMVDAAAKAAGYDKLLHHGTPESTYTPGKWIGGDASNRTKLEEMASRFGINGFDAVASVLERWKEYGMLSKFGATDEDVANARTWQNQAKSGYQSRGTHALNFNQFEMPSGEQELGTHLGTVEQALNFGEYAHPFFVKLGREVRLADLGTWNYQAAMMALRKKGVKISDAEYEAVYNANDNNQALRELLISKGVNSIVYKNEAEARGDSHIVFSPNQIKSADPITRDAEGNVIPLSQRFNDQSNDIRFSLAPETVNRLNRAVEAAQTASGDITESEQTPIKDRPVHTFAQQSGEARVDAAVQIVDALEAEGTPKEELVDALNSYELHKQLGIEKDPDMLSILMAEAMRRDAPGAFSAYEVTRERAGRALGVAPMLHNHPRYQHLFVLNGIKKEHQQQANDIAEANADIKADEIKKLDAESGRTAAQEQAETAEDAAFRAGEEALSKENKTLWQKAKDLITRIGASMQILAARKAKNAAETKPSIRGTISQADLDALNGLSDEDLMASIEKDQKALRSVLKGLTGTKEDGGATSRRVATMVNRMSEQLGVPTDITSAVEALTASQDSLRNQFEQSIVDSLTGKVRSATTPKKAPSKNLNSVIKQITRILADNLNLPKTAGASESLGEKALDAFGRVRNNEQLIREAWEKAREQIRVTLAKRATEGLEGLTEEEAADIEQQVDEQLAAIASEVPEHLWARGQAFSVLRDALAETSFDDNTKIMADPEGALKAAQGKINEAVEKVGNVDPARWASNQSYIIAAFNQLVADLRAAKAKSDARRRTAQRAGVFSPTEKETFNRLMDSARKRAGDKTPLLPENISWGKLFSSSPQSQEAKAKAMMEYMKADPVLSNLTAAEQQKLADMFAKQWEAKRTALTEAKVAAVLKRRHATQKGKEVVKGAIPKFIQAINRGELNQDIIAQEIAEKFGFQKLTDAENKKLETLAKELQEPGIPVHERRAKTDEIVKIIARKTGLSTAEILSAWWVTSVLSGPRTIFTIGMAFLSGGFEVFTHAAATVINAHLQGRRSEGTDAAMQSITNYFKSYPRAVQLAWQYVRTGDKNLLSDSDPAFMQFFDTGRNNPQSIGWRMTQSKNPATRMLGRFMHFFEKMLTAGDLFNSTITRHGMLPVAQFLNSRSYDKARVADETDLANYRKKALNQWWGDKEPKTAQEQALVTRQAIDLMEAVLAKYANVLEDANFVAAQGAMTLNPEGLGGKGYRAIRGIANRAETSSAKAVKAADKLKADEVGAINKKTQQAIAFLYHFATHQMLNLGGLRFARFAGNKLNQSIGFVPLLGLARLYEKDYAGQIKSQAIIKNQVIGAMVAMVGITILKAVSDEPDDEKRGWGIEGSWAGLSADKIKQLMAAGRKQNSIHFGEHTFNYSNWPISSVLAAFGAMADRIKYNPKDWKEATSPEVAYTGLWAAMTSTFDTTALSQLSEILGSNVHSRDPVDASIKKVSRVFGNFAGGFIPRVFKDIDLMGDGKLRKYEGWENFAKEVPYYRRYVGGPLLDIFGKQVEVSRTPWSREYLAQPEAKEYRLLGELGSNGLWLTPADPGNRRVGRGKRSREMTDAEQKRFVTIVGDRYRELVLRHGERLTQMPHENAKDLLGKLSAQARDRAERQALVAPAQ